MNQFEEEVKNYLISQDWNVYKNGWPDLLCCRETNLGLSILTVEVKSQKDKLSEAQQIAHKILRKGGIPVYIIRPEHLTKKCKPIFGKLLWSSRNYILFKETIENLKRSVAQNKEQLQSLEKNINELTILFDEGKEWMKKQ